MKTITVEIEPIDNLIEIVPIADVHIGSHEFNETLFKNTIDYILEKKNRYCILNGDIVDNATRNSIANVFENDLTPNESVALATKYLMPLVEQNKILCYTSGNHEDRSNKDSDITPAVMLASNLFITDRYSPTTAYIFASVKDGYKGDVRKRICFHIFVAHGKGGGRSIGAKANSLEAMSSIVDADVYIHSHTHAPISFKQDYLSVDDPHKQLIQKERLYVNTNAFLNYGGYGEKALYKPASQSIPKIYLKIVRDCSCRLDRLHKVMWCEI